MSERIGYRPREIRTRTLPRRHPRRENIFSHLPYSEQEELRNGRKPWKFSEWWGKLKPGARAIWATAAVALLGGAYEGVHQFGLFQTRNMKPDTYIQLNPKTIPGHDELGGTTSTSKPSVSVPVSPGQTEIPMK